MGAIASLYACDYRFTEVPTPAQAVVTYESSGKLLTKEDVIVLDDWLQQHGKTTDQEARLACGSVIYQQWVKKVRSRFGV